MGYFANLEIEILDLYEEGIDPAGIARVTGATLTEVLEVISRFENGEFDDEPVGPDDSYADAEALASAGLGTDEDYGYYGEE